MFKLIALLLMLLSPAVLAESDSIVLEAGEVAVSYEDVERYITEKVPEGSAQRGGVLARKGIFREMAENLYIVRTMAAEGESMPGFDKEQAEWTAHLVYQRTVMDEYRTKYVVEMLKDVNWEETARETYQVEKERYMTKETVNASHILIKVKGRSDEEALALAQELQQRAKKGENFKELASQYSEDPSASRNAGSLGSFKRGQMVKPFDDVVFDMQEPGDISEVVKTPFGYHVIQYHGRKMPEAKPFASVKDKLIEELQTKMGQQVWQDKVIAIRSSSDIVLNEKLLLELQEEYAPPSVRQ